MNNFYKTKSLITVLGLLLTCNVVSATPLNTFIESQKYLEDDWQSSSYIQKLSCGNKISWQVMACNTVVATKNHRLGNYGKVSAYLGRAKNIYFALYMKNIPFTQEQYTKLLDAMPSIYDNMKTPETGNWDNKIISVEDLLQKQSSDLTLLSNKELGAEYFHNLHQASKFYNNKKARSAEAPLITSLLLLSEFLQRESKKVSVSYSKSQYPQIFAKYFKMSYMQIPDNKKRLLLSNLKKDRNRIPKNKKQPVGEMLIDYFEGLVTLSLSLTKIETMLDSVERNKLSDAMLSQMYFLYSSSVMQREMSKKINIQSQDAQFDLDMSNMKINFIDLLSETQRIEVKQSFELAAKHYLSANDISPLYKEIFITTYASQAVYLGLTDLNVDSYSEKRKEYSMFDSGYADMTNPKVTSIFIDFQANNRKFKFLDGVEVKFD